MSTRTNHDIAKAKIHAQFDLKVSPKVAIRKGALIKSQQDINDHREEVAARDKNRRTNRVLDPASLQSGRSLMWIGLTIFGVAMSVLLVLATRTDVPHWATYLAAFLGLLGGWSAVAGWLLRSAPNLPYMLNGNDIDYFSKLLDDCDERHRSLSSPTQRQFAFLMLTLEAALLLTLLLPIVADGLSPNAHLALTIPLAVFFGFLEWKLLGRIVHSVAVLNIRKKHYRLLSQSAFPESQTKAATIRDLYGDAVGQNWDQPTTANYLTPVLWCGLASLAVIGICFARFYASDHGAIGVVAAAVLGGVACVFFVVAVAAEVTGAVLIPDVATARRVIDRFPSRNAFEKEMVAHDAAYDAQIAEFFRHLRQGYEAANRVTAPGVPPAAVLDFSVPRLNTLTGLSMTTMPAPITSASTVSGIGQLHSLTIKGEQA